jgi:hypothetical protein
VNENELVYDYEAYENCVVSDADGCRAIIGDKSMHLSKFMPAGWGRNCLSEWYEQLLSDLQCLQWSI